MGGGFDEPATEKEQLLEAIRLINKLKEEFQEVQNRLDKAEILLKNVRERNVYVETILSKLIN